MEIGERYGHTTHARLARRTRIARHGGARRPPDVRAWGLVVGLPARPYTLGIDSVTDEA